MAKQNALDQNNIHKTRIHLAKHGKTHNNNRNNNHIKLGSPPTVVVPLQYFYSPPLVLYMPDIGTCFVLAILFLREVLELHRWHGGDPAEAWRACNWACILVRLAANRGDLMVLSLIHI